METKKLTEENKKLIKQNYPGLTQIEFDKFCHIIEQTGLDPLRKQIWVLKRGTTINFETSIDGFRLIAERTEKYAPGRPTEYVYDENGKLVKATAFVKKQTADGTWHEIGEDAFFAEFGKNASPIWKTLPHVMLAKCAESRALRRAFPDALSGLDTDSEMDQSEPAKIPEKPQSPLDAELIKHSEDSKNLYRELLNSKKLSKKEFYEIAEKNNCIESDMLTVIKGLKDEK